MYININISIAETYERDKVLTSKVVKLLKNKKQAQQTVPDLEANTKQLQTWRLRHTYLRLDFMMR